MTTAFLVGDLMCDEGLRRAAYRDGGGVWTIGYGHTGAEIRAGVVWTLGQAIDTLIEDIAIAQSELDEKLPWWRTLDDVRQDVLVELAFNLGSAACWAFTGPWRRSRPAAGPPPPPNCCIPLGPARSARGPPAWRRRCGRVRGRPEGGRPLRHAARKRRAEGLPRFAREERRNAKRHPLLPRPLTGEGDREAVEGASGPRAEPFKNQGEKPMTDTTLPPPAPMPISPPPLLAALVHDFAQKALTAAAAALAAHGAIAVSQESQLVQLGVSAALFGASCGWTWLAARRRVARLEAALAAPAVK